jgi:hypothetical protein
VTAWSSRRVTDPAFDAYVSACEQGAVARAQLAEHTLQIENDHLRDVIKGLEQQLVQLEPKGKRRRDE